MKTQEVMQLLVGPSGRYVSGLLAPEDIIQKLFPHKRHKPNHETAVKIINGRLPLSSAYTCAYRGPNGLTILETDICNYLGYYISGIVLIDICRRLHDAVHQSDMSTTIIADLDSVYISADPTREEICQYISRVLYHTLSN